MSEAAEQATVIEWCDWHGVPVFHIPNGGYRNGREAANLKRQGVKAGVPDLFVPVPKCGYHGLFIEMKVGRNQPTVNQRQWQELLRSYGYASEVCYGADRAISLLEGWMRGRFATTG